MNGFTLIALPSKPVGLAPLAREYAALEAARTLTNWDRTEDQLSAIVAMVPPAQRRALHALVREMGKQ